MSEEEVNEEAIEFTLEELRGLRDQIDKRIKQLESLKQNPQITAQAPQAKITVRLQSSAATDMTASEVTNQLEELPLKRAKSKKCYWVRGDEVPGEVRNVLRRNRNELVAGEYRYVILDNDNILRFERNK